ncbi:hypothetical protein ABBQ38_013031 [Trebouxia sp. C0009 RCD-2024]
MVQGERHYLGTYTSPGEAACVYDEACIFLKKEPVNFPMSQYDVATILQIPDFETFVKQKKATGKPKARTSRFNGVSRNKSGKWLCRAQLKGQLGSTQVRMSAFPTEEMAARAHDKMRIYQGLDTSNFPIASYELQPILKHKTIGSLVASSKAEAKALKRIEYSSRPEDFAKFVQHSREMAARLVKSQQTSRFTGVSWSRRDSKWEAYVLVDPPQRKVHIGSFEDEHEAAQAVDERRKTLGREPVNFPLKSSAGQSGQMPHG